MSSGSLCRLCGTESSNVVKVFTDQGQLSGVGEMMLDCLFTTVEPGEGYPDEVCQFCHLQLNVFFEFKKKVMEQHNKFTSLLQARPKAAIEPDQPPAKASAIEKKHSPFKQEKTLTFSDKNYIQEAATSHVQFKKENSMDAYDSDENLLEIMEGVRSDHIENDNMDAFSVDLNQYDSNYAASDSKQEEDEEVQLVDAEYNAIEANEFEEEHLDEDFTEPTGYAYEPQDYEKEFFKSLQCDTPKLAQQCMSKKKLKLDSPEENEAYHVEFIDDDESLDNEEDAAYNDTLKTPKKTTTIVGNQRKIAYQCRQCLKVFPTLAKFLQHIKIHRAKEKCKDCKTMVYAEYMSKHMAKHLEIKPFKCKLCGKGFSTKLMCDSHEYRHLNVRTFKCNLCEKAFKLGCDLRIHMNCHNDVRKYACEICSKTFRMHSHLANHRETHATENTLECEECGLMFKTTVTLKSHMRQIHAEDHEYKCTVCNRGFYRKNKLERHEQSHLRKMKKLTGEVPDEKAVFDDIEAIEMKEIDMEAIDDLEAIDETEELDDMKVTDEIEFIGDEE